MDKKPRKFNPTFTSAEEMASWVRDGDFEAAKGIAQSLMFFLSAMAENREAQQAVKKAGVPWIGNDFARLIVERLGDDPKVDKEAQANLDELIKSRRCQRDELERAFEKVKAGASTKGKSGKTGYELFAKVLVPNKPSKPQHQERWLAAVADENLTSSTKKGYQQVADFVNALVDENNKIMKEAEDGKRASIGGYHLGAPFRKITRDQLEKAHRKFKPEIDKAKGITRHRMK